MVCAVRLKDVLKDRNSNALDGVDERLKVETIACPGVIRFSINFFSNELAGCQFARYFPLLVPFAFSVIIIYNSFSWS